MKHAPVAFCLSLALAFGLLPSVARADQPYSISIDGRPLTSDPKDTGASLRDGVVYIDAVKAIKAFNGLVTFTKNMNALRVTIDHRTANFLVGRASMEVDGTMIKIAGAPFLLRGDLYVPLTAIARVARAQVSFDKKASIANVTTRSRPPPPLPIAPVPTANPSAAPTGP